ncbi:CGGC domain-containing protein [Bilophila wadsworthia]|uniref:CGGC domain-containing protein n=1 Tax=Bilophila wadsworthia TaxID=35833 RepID=UPI0026741987|nr:CGGC domain-containing protein [Bilophila wadsworthia]
MKVGIIRCQQTEELCPGTGDFAAVEKKSGAFETLGDCTIVGFVSCGGCPGSKAIARAQALMAVFPVRTGIPSFRRCGRNARRFPYWNTRTEVFRFPKNGFSPSKAACFQ